MVICVLRIAGRAAVKKDIDNTLRRLKLGRKFNCVFVDEKDNVKLGMVKKVENYVAYGIVSDEFMKKIEKEKGEKDKSTGKMKKYFRLCPPKGGFKKSTKLHATSGRGILGKWKDDELTKLIEKML